MSQDAQGCVRFLASLSMLLLLASCGGGGATGSSGSSGGGGGSGGGGSGGGGAATVLNTWGPVAGFGSLIVNGVEFDTSGATVTISGAPASIDELKTGHVVRIRSGAASNGRATATRVDFDYDVVGPILNKNSFNGDLDVMGQRVFVTGTTLYGGAVSAEPSLQKDFAIGDIVAISGHQISVGDPPDQNYIIATRMEKLAAAATYRVTGKVSNFDAQRRRFDIHKLAVDFSSATTSGSLTNGQCATVAGRSLQPPNLTPASTLVADSIKAHACVFAAQANERALIDGWHALLAFRNDVSFDIGPFPIWFTDGVTKFDYDVAPSGGVTSRVVTVEGVFDSKGILQAERIRVRDRDALVVRGPVEGNGTALRILGISVLLRPETRFEDRSSQALRTYGASHVRSGDVIEVHGYVGNEPNTVYATWVQRRDPGLAYYVRGYPENVDATGLTILGVRMAVDGQTQVMRLDGDLFGDVQNTLEAIAVTSTNGQHQVGVWCDAPCAPFVVDVIRDIGSIDWLW
ncbi:MAG: hypothetical protein IT337_07800 [Thermomicrobiales bacterium]|nr:hypothetical protein [Thermomicrobiales bacterium]